MSDVTQILSRMDSGDPRAAEELLPLVYAELRRLAAERMKTERADHTLQATALVHEAYLRLVGSDQSWKGRTQFFAAAANSMRQILVDWARRHRTQKHGVRERNVNVFDVSAMEPADPDLILFLDEALTRLAAVDPNAAELVKLRFFAGLSVSEAGQSLSLSRSSAYRCWEFARVWFAASDFAGNAR